MLLPGSPAGFSQASALSRRLCLGTSFSCSAPAAGRRQLAAMPFKRNAEIGRVAVVNYGAETGKLVVISDIVDQNRALVDRPDEVRRVMNFKRLALTDLKVDIPRLAKKKVLSEALSTSDAFLKFEKSAWGQKLASRQHKTQLTDFERFLAVKTRSKKAAKTRKTLAKMKKDAGLAEA